MEERVLKLLGKKDYVPSNPQQLMRQLRLPPPQQGDLQRTLRRLEQDGKIVRTKAGRYISVDQGDLITCTIRINRQGKGFVQLDEPTATELVIPESATGTALDGDRVLIRRDVRPQPPHRRTEGPSTGSVVRILQRRRTRIVGTLQQSQRFLYVIPDDPRLPHDVYVPPARDVGRPAHVGDKVVVELAAWESRHTNPEGEIIEVLGAPDEEGVDLLSIIRQHDLPLHFPKPVLREANALVKGRTDGQPLPEELHGRTDCRAHSVVTIDPASAKDFDDAICLQRVSSDRWRLWVHIADVSHYVKPGTELDREARRRGNSTYLVDRVIPMLPEALSNEVCSLNPGVDRLTKCVEFLLNTRGEVLESQFYSAVIRSQHRYNYGEVLELLQRPPRDPRERMLHDAHQLAQRLRRNRMRAGSLDLDFPEVKIHLDDRGRVARIERTFGDISHQLIEEYMLLANEAVARNLKQHRRPSIYRVHESPAEQRLREYREEVLTHGIACGNLVHRVEVQRLLHRLSQDPVGAALKVGFLRSLMRARYAPEPRGHYGLSKPDYTHFTSPIRRYADLVVHRSLFEPSHVPRQGLRDTADHISQTERNSDEAERESKDVKLYAHLGEQIRTGRRAAYRALVIELRNFGFFVDVSDLGMNGLVHLSSLADDYYVFDPARNHLLGRHTRRVIKIGDHVSVEVDKVDTYKKQIDFRLARQAEERPAKKRRPTR